MGVNLEGKMAYAWLQLQAGATIQRSRYKEAVTWSETNPDLPAQKKCSVRRMCTVILPPPYSGQTSGYFFHWYLYGNHAGSTSGRYIPEDREEKTPDFFDLNMKVAYDFLCINR